MTAIRNTYEIRRPLDCRLDVFGRPALILCLILCTLAGCASTEDVVRDDHVEEYTADLDERTADLLAERSPLSLADCTEIALANSLEARASDLDFRLAQLDRKASFASFLPTVDLTYDYTAWDRQPKINAGGRYMPMFDASIGDAALNVQVPLFVPSAWFLYGMRARGEEIGALVTELTRQKICVQVASLYFGRLELDEAERALESQIAAAGTLVRDLISLREEGLVPAWQAEEARTCLFAREVGLDEVRRTRRQVESELLAAMGLAPWAALELERGEPLAPIDASLEEVVAGALLANPRLHVSDRNIEAARARINLAVAEFLPSIVGFGSLTRTDDSFQKYSTNIVYGLSGVMSLFNGFRSVSEYKSARAAEEQAFLAREEETLAVILQATRAYRDLETARDGRELAGLALAVAESRLGEARAQEAEGLVSVREKLTLVAERDRAAEECAAARFREQVAIATVMNVLGRRTFEEEKETQREDETQRDNETD